MQNTDSGRRKAFKLAGSSISLFIGITCTLSLICFFWVDTVSGYVMPTVVKYPGIMLLSYFSLTQQYDGFSQQRKWGLKENNRRTLIAVTLIIIFLSELFFLPGLTWALFVWYAISILLGISIGYRVTFG